MARNATTAAPTATNGTPSDTATADTGKVSKHRARLNTLGIERLTVEIPSTMFDALTVFAKREYNGNMPQLVKLLLADSINGATLTNADGTPITIDKAPLIAVTPRTRTNKAAMTAEEKAAHEAARKLTTKYESFMGRRLLENFKLKTKGLAEKSVPTFDEWLAEIEAARLAKLPTAPNVAADAKGNIVNK